MIPACPADILTNTSTEQSVFPCNMCGKPVAICDTRVFAVARRYGVTCDPCADAANRETTARALANSRQHRLDEWERLCPPDFQNTEPHRLPSPSKLQRVLAWHFGPRGLVLHGPTGTGKSRCAWELSRREFLAGRSVRVLNHSIHVSYPALFADGGAAVARWADGLVKAEILLLDDAFKAKAE